MFDAYEERDGRLEKLRALLSEGKVPESALKVRREVLKMSQRSLAQLSGVSQSVISRVESGDKLLTDAAAQKLAAALKMDRQELGLAETLSWMRSLAVKGELEPKATADIALHLLQTQPESEAGRRVNDVAITALADIAEAAAETYGGSVAVTKTRDRQGRRGDRTARRGAVGD